MREPRLLKLCQKVRFSDDRPNGPDQPTNNEFLQRLHAEIRGNGLRASAEITPRIHAVLARVSRRLSAENEFACHILPHSELNAYAVPWGPDTNPMLVIQSRMLEFLDDSEMEFVIGHEIGHLALQHTQSSNAPPDSEFAILKQQWRSRAAEISADRVGLLGCQSLNAAGRVMVKLASGLPTVHLQFNFEKFLAESENSNHHDEAVHLQRSHPTLPVRLNALIEFARSRVYRNFTTDTNVEDDLSVVNARVRELLHSSGDRGLVAREEDRLGRTLAWCAAALVLEDQVVTDAEESTLKSLVGEELGTKVAAFARGSSREEVLKKCEESIQILVAMDSAYLRQIFVASRRFGDSIGLAIVDTALGKVLSRFETRIDT